MSTLRLRRPGRPARPVAPLAGSLGPPPPPSAFAAFGAGTWIVPPTAVEGAARITVGTAVVVLELGSLVVGTGGRLHIGDRVRLGRFVHVHCAHEVVVEADASAGDHVSIVDTWGPLPSGRARAVPPPDGAPVLIGRGAYLGGGSVIGPGVRIGAGAYVGEGAVVVADVPPHAVVYGNPARVTRWWDPIDGGAWRDNRARS